MLTLNDLRTLINELNSQDALSTTQLFSQGPPEARPGRDQPTRQSSLHNSASICAKIVQLVASTSLSEPTPERRQSLLKLTDRNTSPPKPIDSPSFVDVDSFAAALLQLGVDDVTATRLLGIIEEQSRNRNTLEPTTQPTNTQPSSSLPDDNGLKDKYDRPQYVATQARKRKRREGELREVVGKCDRCRSFLSETPCEVGEGEPRCIKCQVDKQGCYWDGVSRTGTRSRVDEAINRGAAKEARVARTSKEPSGSTKPESVLRGSQNIGRDRERSRTVNDPAEDESAMIEAIREELTRVRARIRVLEGMAEALEKQEMSLVAESYSPPL